MKKKTKRAAALGTATFTNTFNVDIDIKVDLEQYIAEYPEDFDCQDGEEVMEKLEVGEITRDDIIGAVTDFLWGDVETESYINDSVGVECSFDILDMVPGGFDYDWQATD